MEEVLKIAKKVWKLKQRDIKDKILIIWQYKKVRDRNIKKGLGIICLELKSIYPVLKL